MFKCIELLDDPTDWKMIKVKICQNTPGKRKEEKKGKKRREKEKENDSSNIPYILIQCFTNYLMWRTDRIFFQIATDQSVFLLLINNIIYAYTTNVLRV